MRGIVFLLLGTLWGTSACTNPPSDDIDNLLSGANATKSERQAETTVLTPQTRELTQFAEPQFNSLLSDFPLQVGNTWVYSHTAYFLDESATFIITDTVVGTQTSGVYYVAEMERTWIPVLGTLASDKVYGLGENKYWYIVDGSYVFRQSQLLNLSNVKSSWLEYIFPLETSNSWYPSSEQRDSAATGFSGHRRVDSLVDMREPAGDFSDCYYIFTGYNNGPVHDWFCPGVGLVETRFDHRGTRYGFRTTLVEYLLQE